MKNIFRNYLYTSAYQIFILLLPIITLPYISRILMPKGIGTNSWVSAINSYFVLFAVLGLTTYGQREIALNRDDPECVKRTFWELELASIFTSVFTLVGYLFFIILVDQHIFLLAIYSVSIIACIFDISWFFSGIENFRLLVIRNFVIKTCSIVLIFLCVRKPSDLWIYVLIQSSSVFVSNLSLWPMAVKIVGGPIFHDFLGVIKRVRHSIWFFIPQASISVYVTLNKVLLGFISTKTQTGYFDTSDKLLRMMFSLFLAASTVILPRISNLYAKKDYVRIKKFITGMLSLSLWAIFLIIFLVYSNAELIVRIVLGPNYLSMIPVLQIAVFMMLPMAISNVLANQYMVPLNKINLYTKSVILGAMFNLAVEIPLIMVNMAAGAALASVLSEATVASIQIFYCRKDFAFREYFSSVRSIINVGIVMIIEGVFVVLFTHSMLVIVIIDIVTVIVYVLLTFRWLWTTLRSIN